MVATALVLAKQTGSAQTWSTVDDFQYSPGKASQAFGLAKDPTGTFIYAAGDGQDASGVFHAVAFKSLDGGTNWSLMDDYINPTSPADYWVGYVGIAADSFGNIYASGQQNLPTGAGTWGTTWFTRRSVDGGTTWTAVDTVSAIGMTQNAPNAIATDQAGNIYVVGAIVSRATNGVETGSTWIVRKGTAGTSWAAVDQLGAQQCSANGVFCHPTAGIFVVGQSTIPAKNRLGFNEVWTVRRSQDNGATWTTVDTYYSDLKLFSTAWGGGVDNSGNIYVVGSTQVSYKGSLPRQWLVRKSTDGGRSWSQVDSFPSSPSSSASASVFGCDVNGNLFVAGYSAAAGWTVRESLAGTGIWQTVDTFGYVRGADSLAIVANSSGNVFVAGDGDDANAVYHWLVRKR